MSFLNRLRLHYSNSPSVIRSASSRIRCLKIVPEWPCKVDYQEIVKNTDSRNFHCSTEQHKFHDLKKARLASKKRMRMLQAKLERLDTEDQPTGCILCPMRNEIPIDYKNVRLLSQFVSSHTGRIFSQTVTGLCNKKQNEVAKAIRRSRSLGYMPVTMKYFEYHNDPKIF